jgi:hypothetical protein
MQKPAQGSQPTPAPLGVFTLGIPSILALVFGLINHGQIKRSAGRQTGRGLAITAIVLGSVEIAIGVVVFLVFAAGMRAAYNSG